MVTISDARPVPSLFPYFGGKRRIGSDVWERLGNVSNFVEPFAGSLAVLLARPVEHEWWKRIETVNDADCYIANFWRALQIDPYEVAREAAWPVNQADLTARHLWLVRERSTFSEQVMSDPFFYDSRVAGWWLWGICSYVGADWCTGVGGFTGGAGLSVTNGGVEPGVYRKMPMASGSHPGRGIHRLHQSVSAKVNDSMLDAVTADCLKVADRLRRVRVTCGDWSKVLNQVAAPHAGGVTGIFLDPPYDPNERRKDLYAVETDVDNPAHQRSLEWAIGNGDNPAFRILYCGYETAEQVKVFTDAGWQSMRWKATRGYSAAGKNREREIVWCSPACLNPGNDLTLFNFNDGWSTP